MVTKSHLSREQLAELKQIALKDLVAHAFSLGFREKDNAKDGEAWVHPIHHSITMRLDRRGNYQNFSFYHTGWSIVIDGPDLENYKFSRRIPYHQAADGSFNWVGITKKILERQEIAQEVLERKELQQNFTIQNEPIAERLQERFKDSRVFVSITPSEQEANRVCVEKHINVSLDEESAATLIAEIEQAYLKNGQ